MMKLFRNLFIGFALLVAFAATPAAATTCSGGTPANTCYWVGGTGTWDGSATAHWSFTSGGATCSCLPSATTDKVILDGSSGGGTVTVNATINLTSITMGAFTGTLDFGTNNNNVTVKFFSGTGTATRTWNMGSGTWTISGNGLDASIIWDFSNTTSLTLSAASSTLTFTSATSAFGMAVQFGTSQTYGTVSLAGRTDGGQQVISFGTALTIATFNISSSAYISSASNGTITITNPVNWVGTSTAPITLAGGPFSTTTYALAANSVLTWVALHDCAFTGSPVANNSINLNGNSGITINPPSGGGGHIIGG